MIALLDGFGCLLCRRTGRNHINFIIIDKNAARVDAEFQGFHRLLTHVVNLVQLYFKLIASLVFRHNCTVRQGSTVRIFPCIDKAVSQSFIGRASLLYGDKIIFYLFAGLVICLTISVLYCCKRIARLCIVQGKDCAVLLVIVQSFFLQCTVQLVGIDKNTDLCRFLIEFYAF